MGNVRPNEQRAKAAIVLLWIVLAMNALSLAFSWSKYTMLRSITEIDMETTILDPVQRTREQVLILVHAVVLLISAVTFIRWFRRAYVNLNQLAGPLAHRDIWAAVAWFVPIIGLFKPYQMMRELHEEANRFLAKKGMESRVLSERLVGIWWAFWIINSFLGFGLGADSVGSIGEMMRSTLLTMTSNVIGIFLALMAIKLVRDYSRVEPLLRESGNVIIPESGTSAEKVNG